MIEPTPSRPDRLATGASVRLGEPLDPSLSAAIRWVIDGYGRRSLGWLFAVLVLYSAVGINYRELIDPSKGMDWLLGGIWVLMTLLLVWRVDLRRDLSLIAVGLVGGTIIEWWGTNTNLWTYFTRERPPLWILPAWPIAALAIDRLTRIVDRLLPRLRQTAPLYWVVMPGFVVLMTRFLWPTIHEPASLVVVGLMVGVAVVRPRPAVDMVLFLTGAGLGIFLEYWGTTRFCWTYYTREQPPIEAVLAHGFATVAFARAVQLSAALWGRRLAGTRR